METPFILNLLIALVVLLLFLAVPIATVKSTVRISRMGMLLRTLAIAAIVFVLGMVVAFFTVGASASLDPEMANNVMAVAILPLIIFFLRWSAGRAQDAGWSKWVCLAYVFPLANLLFFVFLLTAAPAQVAVATVDEM